MKTFNQITIAAILIFATMFAGIWLFNHVYAWLGVAVILLTLYATVRIAVHFINKLNNNSHEK